MENIVFIKPEEQYIREYWDVFRDIIDEGRYLGASEAFPLEDTFNFVKGNMVKGIPELFIMDKSNKKIVGWCDVIPKEELTGYLGIGILNEYRECGIGSKAIVEILKLCKEYGYKKVNLEVRSNNKRAMHVYEKIGFKVVKIVEDGFDINGVKEDIIEMSLQLG